MPLLARVFTTFRPACQTHKHDVAEVVKRECTENGEFGAREVTLLDVGFYSSTLSVVAQQI